LDREVAAGNFRSDLFYRLNVVRIRLPALRDRREDIPPLVTHFCRLFGREAGIATMTVCSKTMEILHAYEWPGNVRQLRNVLHRACILANSNVIQPGDLPPLDSPAPAAESLRGKKLEDIERIAILQTLRDTGGNKAVAAERLGVTTRTLLNKMNKYRALGVA
jgi:DNA-binding NtrC family response regulator